MDRIDPPVVRYIKLGKGGGWERECIENAIARFGYGTERESRFAAVRAGRWTDLTQMFREEGKDAGTATRFSNDARQFFMAGPETLWITYYGQQLWWAFFDPAPPEKHPDTRGTFRRVIGSWRGTDAAGAQLTTDRLAGSLTKLAAYRSTTFELKARDRAYVVRRINGERSPEIERAETALSALRVSARELITLLEPRDFELLVDLVFSTSGWRRLGAVGGTQKTLDIDIELPSTGERAFVQVKSSTNDADLAEYLEQLPDLGAYSRMFFVYHSGTLRDLQDPRVVVIGPAKLAEMVVDAGLVSWLVGKVG